MPATLHPSEMTDTSPVPADVPYLLVFGIGYSGLRIAMDRKSRHWQVTGTTRSRGRAAALEEAGIEGLVFDGDDLRASDDDALRAALGRATHLLISVPPGPDGDPVLRRFREEVLALGEGPAQWIGLLSTTGVYGDRGGDWVDEATEVQPGLERTRRRVQAEKEWSTVSSITGVPLQLFRISGIYGPGRSALDRIRAGRARAVVKEDSIFNRVHVDDLVGGVLAGMDHPERPGIYNLADDLPAPNHEVLRYAAELLGADPPEEIPFEEAGLSRMGASFFAEDRRVRNDKLKQDLEYELRHPTYREGLQAILQSQLQEKE